MKHLPKLIALLVFVFLIPMLAQNPQNGDGSEIVITAMQGGVLHPPGFPIQAWLSRLFMLLPFGNPTERIAILSALAHSFSVYFIAETLFLLTVPVFAVIVASLAYAFFPSVWYLGTYPEVFPLAYFFLSLVLWQSIKILVLKNKKNVFENLILLSFFIGLGFAQHLITVTGLGALFVVIIFVRKKFKVSYGRLSLLLVNTVVVTLSLYLTLLVLSGAVLWPDWGKLSSVSDVIRHMSRIEYGIFSLTSEEAVEFLRGVGVFGKDLFINWHFLLIFLFFAPFRTPVALALWSNVLLALVFLTSAQVKTGSMVSLAILDRFEGTALVPLAVLLGVGLGSVFQRFVRYKIAIFVISLLLIVAGVAINYSSADSRSDRTFEIYRNTIGRSLPALAFYLAAQDLEVFYGVPVEGGVRFPVSMGIFLTKWYIKDVVARIEPRFDRCSKPEDIIDISKSQNIPIYTTNFQLLPSLGVNHFRDGMFYVFAKEPPVQTVADAMNRLKFLCAEMSLLLPMPKRGKYYSKLLMVEYASAVENISGFMKDKNPRVSAAAHEAARAMAGTTDKDSWVSACERAL